MSLFLPNIPQSPDNLDFSQPQLLANNQGLDTVFGIDHYKFSNDTGNKGFHNRITTPPVAAGADADAPTGYARLYASTLTANVGLLQYSKGPNASYAVTGSVPTPITKLHSTGAPLVTDPITIGALSNVNVLNFAGINRAIANIYAFDSTNSQFATTTFYWTGGAFINLGSPVASIAFVASGSTLQIRNNLGVPMNNVYWTLSFERIQ